MPNRRKFSRVIYQVPAIIKQSNNSWSSKILDLSLKGALLATPSDWKKGNEQDYDISFLLNGSDINIDMKLKLVQENSDHLRFEITHIDINSASHLKRLIELNVGDDKLLHRELAHLSDLNKSIEN